MPRCDTFLNSICCFVYRAICSSHFINVLLSLIVKEVWCGVLHHVTNEHEWALSYGSMSAGSCSHGELEDCDRADKKWLEKGGPAHSALTRIVLDKRLLNNVHYYLNFR